MSTNDARLSSSPRPGSVFSDTIKLMLERQKSTLYQQEMLLESAKFTLYQQGYAPLAEYAAKEAKICTLPALFSPMSAHQ